MTFKRWTTPAKTAPEESNSEICDDTMKEYKIVVAGNGGVGKSALTVQLVSGVFVSNYDATIEDSYRKQMDVDGEPRRLEILDTAGTEQFSGMRDLYVRNGHGFVLVYSVDCETSCDEVESLREAIVKIKQTERVPVVLVGNKSDLCSERAVSEERGRQLAATFQCPFYETSAKNNTNVNEIFVSVVREIDRLQPSAKKGKGKRVASEGGKRLDHGEGTACCTML